MINVDKRHLAAVKEILKEQIPECEVRLFGSRLTKKAKSYSDLDLAIIGQDKIKRQKLIHLKEQFENSSLPFRVDLLDWHRISNSFKRIIEKKYIVLQNPVSPGRKPRDAS